MKRLMSGNKAPIRTAKLTRFTDELVPTAPVDDFGSVLDDLHNSPAASNKWVCVFNSNSVSVSIY